MEKSYNQKLCIKRLYALPPAPISNDAEQGLKVEPPRQAAQYNVHLFARKLL